MLNKFWNRLRYGSNIDKPVYMFRLLSNLFRRYFLNQRPLRGIDFAVDFACNLRCKHCFNKDILSSNGNRKMSLVDYARVFKEAESEGILNFCFQGGEFLILKDWEEILKLLNPGKFSISVTTNGTYLDKPTAKRLKELGVNTITISLDSGISEEHDEFRGVAGTYAKAIKAIEASLDEKLRVVINTTITPQSLRSKGFMSLVEFTASENLLLNTIFAAPSGNWAGCEDIIMRDKDIALYTSMCKKYGNIVRDVDSLYMGRGCPGVNESIYITPYGDVFGCAYIHIKLGNLFEESLCDIRKKGMKFFKYQKKCLIAENADFIQQYNHLVKDKALPLSYEAHKQIGAWS